MIVRAITAQWFSAVFVGGISFFVSVMIARELGPELYGFYSVAVSFGAISAILMDGGFSKILQREHASQSHSLKHTYVEFIGLAYSHAMLMLCFLMLLAFVFFYDKKLTVLFSLLFFASVVINQFNLSVLRGQGRFVKDSGWQVGNRLSTALAVVIAIFFGALLPWHFFCAQLIGAILFGFFITKSLKILPVFKLSKSIYIVVLPFLWIDLATTIYFRADMVILDFLNLSKTDIGNYGVAYRLIEAIILVAYPVSLLFFRHFRKNAHASSRVLKDLALAILSGLLAGVLIYLGYSFFSGHLVRWSYGRSYITASHLLDVLALSLIFILPSAIMNQALVAFNQERKIAMVVTIGAVLNIFGNLILIPYYKVIAAAWMTVITEATVFLGFLIVLLWHFKKAQVAIFSE